MVGICAWCHDLIGPKSKGGTITQGICRGCLEYVLAKKIETSEFLNTIDSPVLAVDGDRRALFANTRALLALKKKPLEIENKLGGEVIE